ncbi:MAG: hypothetical protein HZC41_07980 [Chloroflexi bacterium]|nr:hypothetical protein [Chloroflexota bacterium]
MMNQWHNELAAVLPLDGIWEFSLAGQSGTIQTPGVWEAQGYARRVDGPAVYQRRVIVPADWQGQRVQLQFDAVSYYAEVEVNGVPVGSHTGLWTPFAFDVADVIRPGETNDIRLTVYKPGDRFPMRESLAGFLPDVAIPFGGIWQRARLVVFPGAAISDVWVLSDAETGTVSVRAAFHGSAGMQARVRILSPDGSEVVQHVTHADSLDVTLAVSNIQFWQPDHPYRYTAEITLVDGVQVRARLQRQFGFRSLSNQGEQLLFNDVPVSLRGVLNWGWYPDILCPAPDEATIRDEFRRVRELGYNLVKLCLYVPSPLYFEIADEEGMFLWLELPMWLPQVTPRLRAQAPIEYADILAAVHHHPSLVLYSLGCELGEGVDDELLSRLNTIARDGTRGALLCDNSGSGEAYGGLAFDFADFNDYHFYADLHYFNPLVDHFHRDWRPPRPWIFGEFCDADDYRDLDEIAAAYGGSLPWWLTERNPIHPISILAYPEQKQRMAALDLGFDGQALQRISRQQSFVVRKTILEKVRARSGMGGYVVTGIRNTPLATSSMFDDLERLKYAPDAFREFNADAVLVLEQGRARIWKHGGDRPAPVDRLNHPANTPVSFRVVLSHAGEDLPGGDLYWRLLAADGQTVQAGQTHVPGPLPGGAPRQIASVELITPTVDAPVEYTLLVELNDVRNHWPLWVYPAVAVWADGLALYDPAGCLGGLDDLRDAARDITRQPDFATLHCRVLITGAFTPDVGEWVRRGGRALVLQTGPGTLPVAPKPFWREAIKLLYDHPALAGFPHRGYADLQFYHLATDSALDTDRLADQWPDITAVTPIIRRLDARLFTVMDYLVEAQLGTGKLLLSTLRLAGGAGDQVIGLKFSPAGRWLLAHLLKYLEG